MKIPTINLEKSQKKHRIAPPDRDHFPIKKTELTPIQKTPNPGVLRALISVSLQYGLRLCENDPLLDQKLLEYLHEQGVLSTSDTSKIPVFGGVIPMPGT